MIAFSNFLIILSAIKMVNATMMIRIHDSNGIAVVWKMFCNNGTYIAHNCRTNDMLTATINVLFFWLLSDLQLNTLINWYITNTVNAILLASNWEEPLDNS